MLPIAILPVAGLLLGIGGSLSNQTMLATYGLEEIMGPGTILNGIFLVMRDAGDIIFANLPIIFAIGVAIGMAKREKEVAALAAVIAFFIMHASISAMIEINGGTDNLLSGAATSVVGITSLQMGVFGGIIVGLGVALLHNRFYKIELPQVLSFFGGTRFVPIVCALVYTAVGILMYFVWPPIQNGIYAVGDVVLNSGYFGTWVYGLMERLLIPFGLHHVFYLPFWQTAVGGTMEVAGRVVEGAQNIFFAQLADPTVERFAVSATRFMSGKFPLMIFGLPGAALAMYKMSKSENKKKVGGLLLSAALTSMLTGITEPLEFTFLFVAPILYAIHCVFAGLAYMLMHLFEVGVGMTFSGGLIDMFLFGILQGNEKTNWIWIVIVGVFYFIVYYFVFSFLIKRLDLKTPGRGDEEVKLYTRKDVQVGTAKQEKGNSEKNEDEISINICKGLGGKKNISDIDCCATRLRCTVYDKELVNDAILRSTGASGVVHKGQGVQIIYGPRVTVIKSNLEAYMESSEEDTVETKKRLINKRDIFSPVTGRVIGLEEVSDEAFASGALGQGIAIEPEEEYIKAPEDGEVTMIFDTKHAIGFLTNTGIYILIHVGIDTVKLNGKGFENLVNIGDKVKKGTPLMKFDLDYIKKEAVSAVTPIICTELTENQSVEIEATEYVKAEDKLYSVLDYE